MPVELSPYSFGVLSFGAMIAGIYLLVVSGDWAVSAAVSIARRARLSKVFIGATIIAFGTSIPELVTSVNANVQGYPGLALGNVVGSNIANILLVIGAAALVCTLRVERGDIQRDMGIMLLATAILVAGMHHGAISFGLGLAMFLLLAAFVTWQYLDDRIDTSEVEDDILPKWRSAALLLGGLVGLAVGSEILVTGAIGAGRVVGVPDAIIGVTVVALGTSLPELTASIAAALRRETDLIFGNIIGSNTFNILSIVAITAMVKPLDVDPVLVGADMWIMAAVSVGFVLWLALVGRFGRAAGIGLLAAYVAFTAAQFVGGGGP